MNRLVLQFSTSPAFASSIIRRLCHSPYSHVDIVLDGEGLLGVSGKDDTINDLGGVLVRSFHAWPYLNPPKTANLVAAQNVIDRVVEVGRSQIGKPFDKTALWAFLEDQGHPSGEAKPERNWRDQSSWFCSEFVTYCLEQAGFFPYPLVTPKNRISPGDLLLLLNPFMTLEDIHAFST